MIDFKTLQLNQLVSYKTSKENPIANPIILSPKEVEIFEVFKEIITENNFKNIEIRVVGGWVRDHLLNIPSNDLDINIKGLDPNIFVKLLNEKVNKNKFILVNRTLKRPNGREIQLIKTTIYDTLIDFVELKDSAIEDAKKRDFTINALFYNILENKIEDVLNLGITNLKKGIIRICATPPNQIINYDSLPILRMLRFALKYKFAIDDICLSEIEKNKKILQDNLLNEVGKDTIHKDINLIFTGPNPSFAIYSLYRFGLLEFALQFDTQYKNHHKNSIKEKDILNCVNIFIVGDKILEKYKYYFEGEIYDNQYKFTFYSILLTINMRNFTNIYGGNLTNYILSNVLKLEGKNNLRIIHNYDEFNNFIDKNEYNRLNVGILLRKILIRNLSKIILISVAYDYIMKINSNEVLDKIDYDKLENIFTKYFEFYKYMKKENLETVDEIRPIIDAKQIKKDFPGTPKYYLGDLMEALINKQIETNNNFSKEDAINTIKSKIKELDKKFKK